MTREWTSRWRGRPLKRKQSAITNAERDVDKVSRAQGALGNAGAGDRPILRFVTQAHKQEAAFWIATEIERLRKLTYEDLVSLEGQPEHQPRETSDRTSLVLATQVFWDDKERRNVRVLVDVWDSSKRISGSIVQDGFIRAPDGSFVGE
jgi:hypothetical protein